MWFARLDLLAFGKFTDVQLNLGPGFHLIFGPNEAGKSTTLRAIRQLLFGFDERTDDNFVHKNPSLRVGGIVCNSAGKQLEIIRRKSRNDSLRGADDIAVIDPSQWNQLLCGIDESTFCQRYGIDYEQLIAGGHQIATGTGDLGEILFATGSGVMDLNAVKKRLADEAAEIFKPQGKKQRLNLSLVEWQQKNEDVRNRQLSVSAWEEADRSRSQTLAELERLESALGEYKFDASRYRRWQQAIPLLKEFDSLEEAIARLGPAPRLPADFGAKRQNALLLLKEAGSYAASASSLIRTAEQELEKHSLPSDLLTRADEISKLIAEWGSCQKGQLDRLRLIEERDDHVRTMSQLLKAMGRSDKEPDHDDIGLDRSYRTRLAALGRQQATLVQSQDDVLSQRSRLAPRIQELRETLSTLPPERPLNHLRSVLRTIQGEGDLESRLGQIRAEIASLQNDAQQQRTRLNVGDATIEALASFQLLDKSVIDRFENEFQSNQTERNVLRARLAEYELEQQSLEKQISQLRLEFQVPTETDLQVARSKRDSEWLQIRESLNSRILPTDEVVSDFENLLRETDFLADRLRQEADRVAQLSDAISDLQVNKTELLDCSQRLGQLDAERTALEQRWQSNWPDFKHLIPLPAEMPAWLARRESLLQNQELIRRRRIEANGLEKQIAMNFQLLTDLLAPDSPRSANPILPTVEEVAADSVQNSQDSQTQQLSFGWESDSTDTRRTRTEQTVPASTLKHILLQAEVELSRAEASQSSRRETLETLSRIEAELAACVDRENRINSELIQWKSEWHAAMTELNLPLETIPETATNYLETLNEFADHQRQARQLETRITGIEADVQRFDGHVKTVCRELAPDLIEVSVEDAVLALRDRLLACQREAAIRSTQQAKIDHARTQRDDAAKLQSECSRIVAELCKSASLERLRPFESESESTDQLGDLLSELEEIERSSQNRRELEDQREILQTRLIQLADAEEFTSFLSQVREQTTDDLLSKLREVEVAVRRTNTERDRLNHQLGAIDTKLEEMGGGTEAADAEATRQQWLAQIRSDAEEYVRLKLASTVLHIAIERHREKTRAPVLTIASDFFRELTLNSYSGLRVEEDDHGKPVLVGCKSDSCLTVPVDGMSEGTCDQLYLALRLASLQLEVEPRKDLPLIIDDILIQFDEARSAAALHILARIARQRQVIFFTHHEHLLEIVRQQLPNECHVHRLQA